jgi:thiopurine S-methyltransferase
MNNEHWLERWKEKNIGFHEDKVNSLLIKHFKNLNLSRNSKIFIPLCGKTLDISWFLSLGHDVMGVELSELAVIELFEELNITPKIQEVNGMIHYSSQGIDIFVGDVLHVTSEMLGKIDVIYDRAALVALHKDVRIKYTKHLRELSNTAPQLLFCCEYDQNIMKPTPFSIEADEIKEHYENHYKINLLDRSMIVGGLKGKYEADDTVWLLN